MLKVATTPGRLSVVERLELHSMPEPNSGCWLWTAFADGGYGRIRVNGRVEVASRASWRAFVGEIPDGKSVCHKCDNPICINPAHLFLGTHAENMRDMAQKGRSAKTGGFRSRGEDSPNCIISEEIVREIKSSRNRGDGVRFLARTFGLSHSHVSKICRGLKWSHITLISLFFILQSCGAGSWQAPISYTIRRDGVLRRVMSNSECDHLGKPWGCKEELTVAQFIDKIRTEEGLEESKAIGFVVTPKGEAEIANKIRSCEGK